MQSSGDKASNAPGTGQGQRRLLDWTTLMPSALRRLQRSQGRMVATEAHQLAELQVFVSTRKRSEHGMA